MNFKKKTTLKPSSIQTTQYMYLCLKPVNNNKNRKKIHMRFQGKNMTESVQ